jgi:hypothetical protein
MDDLNEGEERPTMNLRFIDGVLHQQWEIGRCEGSGRTSYVYARLQWRKVPSITTGHHQTEGN